MFADDFPQTLGAFDPSSIISAVLNPVASTTYYLQYTRYQAQAAALQDMLQSTVVNMPAYALEIDHHKAVLDNLWASNPVPDGTVDYQNAWFDFVNAVYGFNADIIDALAALRKEGMDIPLQQNEPPAETLGLAPLAALVIVVIAAVFIIPVCVMLNEMNKVNNATKVQQAKQSLDAAVARMQQGDQAGAKTLIDAQTKAANDAAGKSNFSAFWVLAGIAAVGAVLFVSGKGGRLAKA